MIALILGSHEPSLVLLRSFVIRYGFRCEMRLVSAEAQPVIECAGNAPDAIFLVCTGMMEQAIMLLDRTRSGLLPPIVAVAKGLNSAEMLRLVRSGASDYLDLAYPAALENDIAALAARLRSVLRHNEGRGHLLAVVSASGGCGASSVAVNLAVALAQRSRTCGLIDLHLAGGDLAAILNVEPLHTLADVCEQRDRIDRMMLEQSFVHHACGIQLLASPPHLVGPTHFEPEAIAEVIRLAATLFPNVLADLDGTLLREQEEIILACDRLLLVLRLEFPCLVRTRKILAWLERSGLAPAKILLAANRIGHAGDLPKLQTCKALGRPIDFFLPLDEAAMLAAINLGSPVVLEAPDSKIAKAFAKMAEHMTAI